MLCYEASVFLICCLSQFTFFLFLSIILFLCYGSPSQATNVVSTKCYVGIKSVVNDILGANFCKECKTQLRCYSGLIDKRMMIEENE